ncbi:MAG: hypothetical protein WC701_02470 [Kiritimatiellales bacterium]|jgi:hypothetical protein
MDTACFLRKRCVLALWLIAPLALISGIVAVSRSMLENAQIAYTQSKALERLIPEMCSGLADFEQFAGRYRMETAAVFSEENHAAALNAAAEHIDFTVTAINLGQDPPDKTPEGAGRISLLVKGTGSGSGISAFLNNIHARDPLVYERRIQILPDGTDHGGFALEAELCKVYIRPPKGTAQ